LEEDRIMDKEQLIEFLKENLTVSVNIESGGYGSNPYLKVSLLLDGEVIDSGEDSFSSYDFVFPR
jgi:hypothetical protein